MGPATCVQKGGHFWDLGVYDGQHLSTIGSQDIRAPAEQAIGDRHQLMNKIIKEIMGSPVKMTAWLPLKVL